MRVFIGIKINDENRQKLFEFQKKYIANGRLTPLDNLHLTLVFIGEVNEKEVEKIKQMLDDIKVKKLSFEINKIKNMRDMVIGEVKINPDLVRIQSQLSNNLLKLDFNIDDRKYYPHITLSRKSNLHLQYDISLTERVEEVTLFLSEFTKTGVIYHELYSVKLQ